MFLFFSIITSSIRFLHQSVKIWILPLLHGRSTGTNSAPWWCKQQKKGKTSQPSRLAGGVVFASICVKYSMEVENGFPRPYPSHFFRWKRLKTIKRPTPVELTNWLCLMQIMDALCTYQCQPRRGGGGGGWGGVRAMGGDLIKKEKFLPISRGWGRIRSSNVVKNPYPGTHFTNLI